MPSVSIFILLVLSFLVGGCGSSNSSSGGGNTGDGTITASGNVTISGKLYTGTITASSIKTNSVGVRVFAEKSTPIEGYKVVAVGTETQQTYFADASTDDSGSFTISNLPSGESYYLEIVNDNNKYAAPISFGTSGNDVVMAVSADATSTSIEVGNIVYESNNGGAVPEIAIPSGNLDVASTARAKTDENMVPVGAGNLGKGDVADFTGSADTKLDGDDDGIPNIFDADDDGDGKVDGLDDIPRPSGAIEIQIDGVSNTGTFSNLPEQYEFFPTYTNNGTLNETAVNVGNDTTLAIEIVMSGSTSPDKFSDVRIIEGPSWLTSAKVAGSSLADYPTSGTSWNSVDYKLYKSTDRWTVWVNPIGTPEAGDVLKFQLTDAATGDKSYVLSTLTYVFNDFPRLVKYSYTGSSGLVTKEANDLTLDIYNANSRCFPYEGNTITFIWSAPKDDDGNYITNMIYQLDGITYHTSTGEGDTTFIHSGASLANLDTTTSTDSDFGTLYNYTFTPTTDAFAYFKVDIKAQSPTPGGGNASQMINFLKIGD